MAKWSLFIPTVALGLAWSGLPAAAQIFHDDDGFALWSFHSYGGDVNRPGSTPDRPYWHGDDAVPLALRWHDRHDIVDQYGGTVPPPPPEEVVAVGAAVVVRTPAPRRVVAHAGHRKRVTRRVAKRDCVPTVAAGRTVLPSPPPVQ